MMLSKSERIKPEVLQAAGVAAERLPRHIAIIMDGNGRWARQQGKPRFAGHTVGATRVRPVVEACSDLGIDALTLYSFSTENWSRPQEEIDVLMGLYVEYLKRERQTMMDNNVQFRQVGRREGLPQPVLDELDKTVEMTQQHTGLTLGLALNYGSRREMLGVIQQLARDVAAGEVQPESITEQIVSDRLDTGGLPDPDLLIRTAGEMRISNFLLWQISYAELVVTQTLWPDFDVDRLFDALREFASRDRRFGGVG